MGSKSNTFENDLLKLIFTATTISNIAIDATSSPLTNLYVALHVGAVSDTSTQDVNEVSYTNYARVPVARSAAGWTVTNNEVVPAAEIAFAASGGGTGGTVDYFSIGVASSGATKILYWGAVSPTIAVANGVTPKLTVATKVTED